MKILEINTQRIWRGGEQQTYFITKGLFERGLEVYLLCLKDSPLYTKSVNSGLPVIGVNSDFDVVKYLMKTARVYDIIHCQTSKAQKFAIITKPIHKRPVIFTRRVGFPLKGLGTKIKYKYTDRIVAITDAGKEKILSFLPELNVDVIPDCIIEKSPNLSRIESLKNDLNIKDKKVIGTTTALTPVKDPLTLIEAIKALYKIRQDFVVLHFGDGKLFNQAKDKIKECGLENVYHLMGFCEDVEDFYHIFDVFVITSHIEVLCNSVLEAFMYKVPVVSTEGESLKDLVKDKGLLCPVKDYECLAQSIDRLLDDERLRFELVDRAYRFVMENFRYDLVISKYINIFTEVLS